MLLPTVANRSGFFYALGNTPAVDLTRYLPHGQDAAAILSLGCGDVRNILFTSYNQRGLPSRKLDITCCDIDERVLARNILLFTLLIDEDKNISGDTLWNIYYHLYLNEKDINILRQQTEKLLGLSTSLEDWNASTYGKTIKLCNKSTLDDVKLLWAKIVQGAEAADTAAVRTEYLRCINTSKDILRAALGDNGSVLTALRSAAPLSMQAQQEVSNAFKQYWNDGTVTPKANDVTLPNPMFASLMSDSSLLHYGSDPILGYHLATAFAPLTTSSPLKPNQASQNWKAAAAAKTQFFEWTLAFRKIHQERLVVRFVMADAFALCHTLQHAAVSGDVTANWYRRQWDTKILDLDTRAYGGQDKAPVLFDMIETSNLADHFGALNILVSTVPLLSRAPWATVCTDLLLHDGGSQQEILAKVLNGHAPTLSLLLGVTPIQAWTNAKSESHAHEIFLGLLSGKGGSTEKQIHTSLVWKRDDQFGTTADSPVKLRIEAAALARVMFQTYLQMFKDDSLARVGTVSRDKNYSHFHRGSFVALLNLIKRRVETDWSAACQSLLDKVAQDGTLITGSNYMQELKVQLHLVGVVREPWLINTTPDHQGSRSFKDWKDPAVSITLVIPRTSLDRIYQGVKHKLASPTLLGSLKAGSSASSQWQNLYGDVHIAFGYVKPATTTNGDEIRLEMEEDNLGWMGTSPLVASFMVATEALKMDPEEGLVGIYVAPTIQSMMLYGQNLGLTMSLFETKISDRSAVFVSRYLPGHSAHRVVTGGASIFQSSGTDKATKLSAEILSSGSQLLTITGHIDVTSPKGKRLLQEKAAIDVRQTTPFTVEVVFGKDDFIQAMNFPTPVTMEGKRLRVARTSAYIEIVAPLATPLGSECLIEYICPVVLGSNSIPVASNMSHLNLDRLPVLDLDKKDQMTWLTTLASLQFSAREGKLKKELHTTGSPKDLRVDFKDSLFTMFMLTSGLQGDQTGLFAIQHPGRGGIHILIVVSAMRLDSPSASVVLDAAVIPLTSNVIKSGEITDFLLFVQGLQCCNIIVNDAELELWKKVLPSMAERCRTWTHHASCEYKKHGKVPVSLGFGEQVLCSCGKGRIPSNFVAIPEWDEAIPHATRIAISPIFAVPAVEKMTDLDSLNGAVSVSKERCRNCGKSEGSDSGALKKCMRCQKAKYCSAECQKKDWKKHKTDCKKAEE
ncbi:hypothetical protein S40285_02310 [Stachybotrys chlorohalonatus IBT 40285]|uniref:MYND-type domain-containing protein n=1 Tax=Stachybotrys chlorohalonatus (strain IBT 40285) TaxID=1283841 RepID=A0A084QSG2_STAC4|nr:hypothetical protein S40285_02310 [Stachybotrys chlorohalonata IBT 40285]